MPRYPIRARKRPGRVGLYRGVVVVGGAYVAPAAPSLVVYPYSGGGFYPAIGMGIMLLELICLC